MVKDRFSLESITSSIYGNSNSHSTKAATAFAKNGVMPILFEGSDSVEYYAMAAQESFQEGKQLNMYADLALESLASNVKMIKRLKARGVESAKFSTEAIDVKAVIKKAIFAIKAAFQKFIVAIGNFIKSVANFIGGQLAKFQEKTYLEAKKYGIKKFLTNAKLVKETINVIIPASGKFDFKASLGALPAEILEGAKDITNTNVLLNKLANKMPSGASKKLLTSSVDKKVVPSGRTLALYNIYGTDKPEVKEVKLTDYLKDEASFNILSNQYLSEMNVAVKEMKANAAALSKKMKEADNVAKMIEDASKSEEAKTKLKLLSFEKNLYGMSVQYYLTVYGEFLKIRSQKHRALSIALSKSGVKKEMAANKPK